MADEQQAGEVTIRAMRPADADAVARLHVEQISTGFLSSLGPKVLTAIYSALPRTRAGFGFVAERDGDAIGFIACATNLRQLYAGILWRRLLPLAWRLAGKLFRLGVIRKMLQTFLYPGKIERMDLPRAEVLSVVTAPAARGLGVASRLMNEAFAEFRRRGCRDVKVLVGAQLAPANAYYLKNGFRLAGSICHHGRQENIYVIDLSRN